MITVNFSPKIDENKLAQILGEIKNDKMSGWVDWPLHYDEAELVRIKEMAEKIKAESEVVVCIGIGGSYLGHRAIIEALRPDTRMEIIYAGNSLSRREMDNAISQLGDRDFSVIVISKSGTTLEPKLAFEVFKEKLTEKYGMLEAMKRIYAITDAEAGVLHDEAVRDGYTRFVVPDNVGGRYSVLTAVGMLPMAVMGVDIDSLLSGAAEMAKDMEVSKETNADVQEVSADTQEQGDQEQRVNASNSAFKYAFMRNLLHSKGYNTEVFASFEPATMYFNEWIKQLFGESEGKNRQGVLPASVVYSTDLHSLGQFMQDGRRDLWETIVNYPTDEINAKVVKAVQAAHTSGGLPVLKIDVSSYDEKGFGELIYFFEMACAVSAKLIGVNPFDQPGVEAYKNELKKLMD